MNLLQKIFLTLVLSYQFLWAISCSTTQKSSKILPAENIARIANAVHCTVTLVRYKILANCQKVDEVLKIFKIVIIVKIVTNCPKWHWSWHRILATLVYPLRNICNQGKNWYFSPRKKFNSGLLALAFLCNLNIMVEAEAKRVLSVLGFSDSVKFQNIADPDLASW